MTEPTIETNREARTLKLTLRLFIAGLVAVVIAAALYHFRPDMISPLGALLALMTCLVGLMPTIFYLLSNEKTVPFFPAVGLFQVFCFGLSPFILHLAWAGAPPIIYWGGKLTLTEESIKTLVLVLVGTSALVSMFFLVRQRFLGWLPALRIREPRDKNTTIYLLFGLALAHLAYKFVPSVSLIPSVAQFLDPVGYVVFSTLLILLLKRKIRGRFKILAVLTLLLLIFARLETFIFTPIVLLALCCIGALVYVRAYRIGSFCVLLVVLSLPIYEFTSTVRYMDGGFLKKAEAFFLVVDGYQKGERRSEVSAMETAARRISHTWLFAHVVKKSPAEVPFWNGETYRPLMTSIIPRAFWSGKPLEITGGLFGKRYGLLEQNSRTSVNLPWHIETFVNFGSLGVVFGMALIGIFLAVVDKILNAPGSSELEVGIALGVLMPMTFQDSNFSLMVGTLPQFIICLYLYFFAGGFFMRRLGWRNQ